MKRFDGVILDVDGTLVDSNDLHATAWVEVLSSAGFDVSFDQVRGLIGMGGDKLVPRVTGLEEGSREAEALSETRGQRFRETYLPKVKAFPGTRALVLRMKEAGLRVVVGSSAKKDELTRLLEIAGITDLVEGRTSADDAENSKPDPDIVRAALQSLRLPAERAVMLGDTPYDIEAARRSGVATIALRCGGWKGHELSGAIAIYDSPADLLERFPSSPLAERAS